MSPLVGFDDVRIRDLIFVLHLFSEDIQQNAVKEYIGNVLQYLINSNSNHMVCLIDLNGKR